MTKLKQAARQVVDNGVQGTYAKYYSVPPADFEALREALAEQAEQSQLADATLEPVGYLCEASFGRGQVFWFNKPADNAPLYAAPVRTKDLSDDEILDVALSVEIEFSKDTDKFVQQLEDIEVFARAVIAKFKEKNK